MNTTKLLTKRKGNESARIVIYTEGGNRLEVNGKGNAAESIYTAFYCLSEKRRIALLARMTEVHKEMLAAAIGEKM